jgi:hypothetical protein
VLDGAAVVDVVGVEDVVDDVGVAGVAAKAVPDAGLRPTAATAMIVASVAPIPTQRVLLAPRLAPRRTTNS